MNRVPQGAAPIRGQKFCDMNADARSLLAIAKLLDISRYIGNFATSPIGCCHGLLQSWTWVTFSWPNPIQNSNLLTQSNPIQSTKKLSCWPTPNPIHSRQSSWHYIFWQFCALNKCNISVISIAHDMLLKLKIQSYCPLSRCPATATFNTVNPNSLVLHADPNAEFQLIPLSMLIAVT